MINVYDDDDNIDVDSVHNAEMISVYLTNVSIEYKGFMSSESVKLFENCAVILWNLRHNMPAE